MACPFIVFRSVDIFVKHVLTILSFLFVLQEQKLLKMGDEISRLASYEAECYRKDGVIVSLRNEIAELRTLLSEKEDIILRFVYTNAFIFCCDTNQSIKVRCQSHGIESFN